MREQGSPRHVAELSLSLCSQSRVLNIMKYGISSIPPVQTLRTRPQLKESLKRKRKFYPNFYLEFDCFIASCPPGEGAAKKNAFCATLSAGTAFSVPCLTAPGREEGGPVSASSKRLRLWRVCHSPSEKNVVLLSLVALFWVSDVHQLLPHG